MEAAHEQLESWRVEGPDNPTIPKGSSELLDVYSLETRDQDKSASVERRGLGCRCNEHMLPNSLLSAGHETETLAAFGTKGSAKAAG